MDGHNPLSAIAFLMSRNSEIHLLGWETVRRGTPAAPAASGLVQKYRCGTRMRSPGNTGTEVDKGYSRKSGSPGCWT